MFLRLPSMSPKITVVDFANQAFDGPAPFPLYVDDEGTPATDAYIVQNGQIKQALTNKHFAAKLKLPLTGNARIPRQGAKPETYMRNVAFLPGNDHFADMLNMVQDGYYLVRGAEPGGDFTGEFACHIVEGYHVRNGAICEPLPQGHIVWGCGIKYLTGITMVGSDFEWFIDTFPERPLAPQAFGAPTVLARAMVELL